MRKLILYIFLIYGLNMSAQDLYAIYPINYPKTDSKAQEDGSVLFEKFDITMSKEKEISYKGNFIYKCSFPEYYEYLIEIFEGSKRYLIVSPLLKTNSKGIATPYNLDRGIVLLFDYTSGNKYYANFDDIKRIQIPKAFEFGKDQSHAFMIKDVDEENEELILLQGGKEIKEVRIKIYKY